MSKTNKKDFLETIKIIFKCKSFIYIFINEEFFVLD